MNWSDWLLQHETQLRLSCFFGVFAVMACWEKSRPCRPLLYGRGLRWGSNFGLVFLNSLLLKLVFPVTAVGLAHYVNLQSIGLLALLDLPILLEIIAAVLILDLLIYGQHVLFHKVPILWRLHKAHHADPDYDVTTGVRFHPIEILLSMMIKMVAIVLLGPAAVAVLVFEIILNGTAMFNHSNIQLPRRIESALRYLLVTPDMHRVHHSHVRRETDSNYGFALSVWDRLFKTYIAQPSKGHQGMSIGLSELGEPKKVCRIDGILMIPFR